MHVSCLMICSRECSCVEFDDEFVENGMNEEATMVFCDIRMEGFEPSI